MCVCGTLAGGLCMELVFWEACCRCDGQFDGGCSQESLLDGGAAQRARSPVHLQLALPGPIHQMSDERAFNETKSLPVTHDSQGAVPVMHLFTYPFRCML